jgi:hypothetical protein
MLVTCSFRTRLYDSVEGRHGLVPNRHGMKESTTHSLTLPHESNCPYPALAIYIKLIRSLGQVLVRTHGSLTLEAASSIRRLACYSMVYIGSELASFGLCLERDGNRHQYALIAHVLVGSQQVRVMTGYRQVSGSSLSACRWTCYIRYLIVVVVAIAHASRTLIVPHILPPLLILRLIAA